MRLKAAQIATALQQLRETDHILAAVIDRTGPFALKTQKSGYEVLVQAVISQQISTAAARTIRLRLQALMPRHKLQPEALQQLSDEQLNQIGISRQKLSYLRDLTRCTLDGIIQFRRISQANDEDAITELIQVRGIGRWTAQMYLMFSLGRPDVFAPDDLGLRNAITRLYHVPPNSHRRDFEAIADQWKPWRSVASWYLWRSLEQ
ncbi:MAG: DNA-3-methyladenine glycosylase family protein [Planctomycetaceae bacterium]